MAGPGNGKVITNDNLEKETEEKATRRLGNEIERREEQSKAFVTWKVPVKLSGLQRAIEYVQWETWLIVEMA